MFQIVHTFWNVRLFQSTRQGVCLSIRNTRPPPTFVVEEPLHLHGGPGVSDTQHGAGYEAFLGWRTVCGPDQTPIRLVVQPLQHLHSLASANGQLPSAATITGHKIMNDDCQLAATGELKRDHTYLLTLCLSSPYLFITLLLFMFYAYA